MIRRWLERRARAWERKHPEEAKELAIGIIEGSLGRPLGDQAKLLIRTLPPAPEEDGR